MYGLVKFLVRLGRQNGGPAHVNAAEGDEASIVDPQKATDIFSDMKSRKYPLIAAVYLQESRTVDQITLVEI